MDRCERCNGELNTAGVCVECGWSEFTIGRKSDLHAYRGPAPSGCLHIGPNGVFDPDAKHDAASPVSPARGAIEELCRNAETVAANMRNAVLSGTKAGADIWEQDAAAARAELAALREESAKKDALLTRFNREFCALTPGGSEFHNAPESCCMYVKDHRANLDSVLKQAIAGRKKAEAENARLKADIETLTNPDPATGRDTLRLVNVEQLREIYEQIIGEWGNAPRWLAAILGDGARADGSAK